MRQLLALEIRVDEGADDADLGEAEPEADELGTVLEKDGRAVAFLQVEPLEKEVAHLVAVVFELARTRKVKRSIKTLVRC